jgi:hypothetical protein
MTILSTIVIASSHPPSFQKEKISFNDQASPLITQHKGFLKKNNNICINSRKKVKSLRKQVGDLEKVTPLEKSNTRIQSSFVACLQRLIVMMSFQALSDLILR